MMCYFHKMKNKTVCIKLFCKQKPLLKNIPIVFLLAQVFFFLKRKSVVLILWLKNESLDTKKPQGTEAAPERLFNVFSRNERFSGSSPLAA